MSQNGQVYAIARSSGEVKIGRSSNFNRRLRTIETQSGILSCNSFASETVQNASEVERFVHKKLSEHRRVGEWFEVPFETAVDEIKKSVCEVGVLELKPTTPDVTPIVELYREFSSSRMKYFLQEEAMEDFKAESPETYDWLVKNNLRCRYVLDDRKMVVDFIGEDGERNEMPAKLFFAILQSPNA